MRFHFFSSQINMLLTRQKEKTMMQSHSQKCDTQLPHLLQFWKEASMVFFFFLNNIYIYIYIHMCVYGLSMSTQSQNVGLCNDMIGPPLSIGRAENGL